MAKKILTIDDSEMMREIVKRQIISLGYEAIEAVNGAEGLKLAVAEKPDLILLDVTMPLLDGRQTLVALRANPETAPMPVIMVTGESDRNTVMQTIQAGISDYIVKPFNSAALAEKINKVLTADLPRAAESRKVTVLVVDDKMRNLSIAREAIQDDYEVVTALSGEQALQVANASRPAVILIDMHLPDMNGFQLAEKLKALGLLRDCKLAALSVKNAVVEQERAVQMGFAGVILKPLSTEDVRTVVLRLLNGESQVTSQEKDRGVLRYVKKENAALFPESWEILQRWQEWLHDLADNGRCKLAVDLTPAPNLDMEDLRFVRTLASKAQELGVRVVFVIGQPTAFKIRRFWESQPNETTATLEEALKLLG